MSNLQCPDLPPRTHTSIRGQTYIRVPDLHAKAQKAIPGPCPRTLYPVLHRGPDLHSSLDQHSMSQRSTLDSDLYPGPKATLQCPDLPPRTHTSIRGPDIHSGPTSSCKGTEGHSRAQSRTLYPVLHRDPDIHSSPDRHAMKQRSSP
uniref:Uncharacterized protein n=1 Tax=Myotis myotis TaxID=51298 RepID=A0A7J7WHZ3_MYOMY|nr:hypothetical protein mMyoMyo1_012057 [Myotis myotis]